MLLALSRHDPAQTNPGCSQAGAGGESPRAADEAQAALRLSEERFRIALGSGAVTVFEQDLDLRYVWLYPPEAHAYSLGLADEELLPNEEGRRLAALKREVIRTGRGIREEVRVNTRIGLRWYDLLVEPRRDAGGAIVGIAGTALDITQRKLAEERAESDGHLLRQVLDQMPMGVILVDASAKVLLRNAGVGRISRRADGEGGTLGEWSGLTFFREDGTPYTADEWPLTRALRSGVVVQSEEMGFDRGDGMRATLRASAAPILDARGERVAAVTVFDDVTERSRAEQFAAFLSRASEVLASSLDYRTTLAAVADLVVPRIADWCAIDLLGEDGRLRRLAVAHVDPAKVRSAHEIAERYPPDPEAAQGAARIVRTGRPEHVAVITDAMLAGAAKDAEHLRMLRELGLRSYIGVPLVARGRTLGVISLISAESGRMYTEQDVAQAMELARRAATAVDNALLYQSARDELAERRRVEAELRMSEERFRAAFEQSPIAKQIFAPDGRCIAANPAWAQLWQSEPDGFLGYNILEDPQLEARGVLGEVRRAFAGEVVHLDPIVYDPSEIRKAGRARYVQASLSPVRSSSGEVTEVVLVLADVTEKVEAETALRGSEERLRTATRAGRIGVWEWDMVTDRVIWSPEVHEIHRIGAGAFGGTAAAWERLVHPEDRARVRGALEGAIAGKEDYALEFRGIAGDGEVQWLWTRATVHRDEAGKAVRMVGATLDVTERKRAEHELRESELRHRLVNRATNDVIWEWDLVTDRVQWNEAVIGAFGWTPGELGGAVDAWYDRIHPDDRDRVAQGIRAAIDTGEETWSDEYRFRRKDGTYATFLDRGFIARSPEGQPHRMIGSMLDLTERRSAEEALAEAYQRLNSVLAAITEGYIALDTELRFIAVNPAAQRLAFDNRPVEEMLGRGYADLYSHLENSESFGHYTRALGEQVDVHFEARSGITGRWLETHAYPRRWGLEVYIRDITERMEVQAEMHRQARELARSNQELQDFAYVASHDLKEPLRGISTYASILAEDYAPRLDAAGADKLATIDRLARRMYGLLDALLEYSRIGRSEFVYEAVDLGRVVADAMDSLRGRFREEHAEVSIAPQMPCIACDRFGVLQLFTNLIANAVKYNTSSPKRVEIGHVLRDGQAVCFVRDNGIGIAPQHHERVFAMFKRLHKREEYGGGVGAGLAIVKKVVEHHGGRIWVESEPGRGSTFWFSLGPSPAYRSVRMPGEHPSAEEPERPASPAV